MFVVLCKIRPCLSVIVTKHKWTTITKNTSHGLRLQCILHLHVGFYSHKKEVEHKCFLPCDFQIVLWTCNLLIFFSLSSFFGFWVFFV
jgi:hypothetical protein